jgi:uncharacterized protein YndB with AHSA1/START domain
MTELERAVFKVHIKGNIEDVWREITKTDEVQGVMFNMKMDCSLEVGAPWRMRTKNGKYTGIVGEVLVCEPPHHYAHTFKFTSFDDPPCVMRYELKEADGGVDFTMISEEMPIGTKSTKQMKQGGHMIVDNLKSLVETGKLPLKTRLLYAVFALMEPFSPAKIKSENWP